MKKILIIGENPLAATKSANEGRMLSHYLNKAGHETAFFSINYTGWPFKSDIITSRIYPWAGPADKPMNAEEVFEEFKPDTLLLIGPPLLFKWIKTLKNRKKYKAVMSTSFKSLPINKFMKEVYTVADTVVVNSKYEENALKNAGVADTVFIPVGLDLNRLKTFQKPGMNDGRYRIACMAQDVPLVDFPSVIKGFGIAAKADPSFMFGIFSDPSQLNMWNFNDMFDVYGLKDRCVIMNPQPETNFGFPSMGEVYASSDLIVSPHQEDILNISAIEADYCGTKVLTSSFGPTKEYLSDKAEYLEKTDVYYAPPMNSGYKMFDSQEIADKIIFSSMNHKPRHAKETKENKKMKKASQEHSWEKAIKNWLEVI